MGFDADRFAVISDIHGNADALAAVIADLRGQGVQTVLNLGDHFSGPLAVVETAELLAGLDQFAIRGNHDRALISPERMGISDLLAHRALTEAAGAAPDQIATRQPAAHQTPTSQTRAVTRSAPQATPQHTPAQGQAPALDAATRQIGGQALPDSDSPQVWALRWLSSLPATLLLGDVFLCHGTPASDNAYWLDAVRPDGAVTQAGRDEIAAQIKDIPASLFLCGHSHVARRVDLPGGRVVVNPGSVGCPGFRHDIPHPHVIEAGSPAARYAILTRRGQGWVSELRAVPYDARRMARLACQAGQGDWARVVGTGWLTRQGDAGDGLI